MAREITERELRNDSGAVMHALAAGESFVVTRNGVPVGELVPIRRRQLVSRDAVLAVFAQAAPLNAERFRTDLDAVLDQNPAPRG
jgi:prevent-host-death family protein